MARTTVMSRRPGFSLMELLVVLTLFSIAGSFALPVMRRTMAQLRVQRGAQVVVSNLQLAQALAGRQRVPVRLSIDSAGRVMRIRSYRTPATVYAEQRLDVASQMGVQQLAVSDTSAVIYPNGLVEKQVDITLREADQSRVVRMTRTGQIWIVR